MASTYLSKTPASAGNRTKWTFAAWVKRAGGGDVGIFVAGASGVGGSKESTIRFETASILSWQEYNGSGFDSHIKTHQKFRDPSAWYHLVFAYDSANATAALRCRIWVNGIELTNANGDFGTYVEAGSSYETAINNNVIHNIGAQSWNTSNRFNGCMSHVHFTDGYAYTASDFGEFDATSGIWKIKTGPSVTYGTNGFFVLEDAFSGTDQSGENNDWTTNGTGTTTKDNPSNNFATFNPSCKGDNAYTNSNLTATTDSNNWHSAVSSLCVGGGKWYVEYKWNATGGTNFGIADARSIDLFGQGEMGYKPTGALGDSVGWYGNSGAASADVKKNGVQDYVCETYDAGDIISIALDCDNGAVYFRKNGGSWQNSGDPTSGATRTGAVEITTGETYFFGGTTYTSGCNISANYGNGYFGTTDVTSAVADGDGIGRFEYAPPTGYYTLCTKNIKAYGG